MDYAFKPFLRSLDRNWFEDDELLGRLLDRYAGPEGYDREALVRWGARVAGPLRELAETSARSPDLPRLQHYDAYGRRVDRILLPDSTREALAVVEGEERMGAPHADPFVFYARGYLYAQNGEAGVVCSLGCTDGLVRLLEALGDGKEHGRAVERIRGSTPERVWHGAQFVTEAQGGSDVPANRTEARREGGRWRIHGQKWFCSNVNADYFLVTARPEGDAGEPGRGPALFLVPAYLEKGEGETDASGPRAGGTAGGELVGASPGGDGSVGPGAGDGEAEVGGPRNGYTIDRLKDKLGTRELATAEVTFHGAVAYAVGPLDRGLPNLVRYVLATSRYYCVQSAASTLRRAQRIAEAYAEFRSAFGRRLVDFPMVRDRLVEIRRARERALGAYFELLRLWEAFGRSEEAALDFRILLSLAKPVLTADSTRLTREAMTLLGGNGIEECFSPLPRLYRDAAIMEIWEGPHDVLYTQALRDLVRFEVDGRAWVERVVGGAGAGAEPAGTGVTPTGDDGRTGVKEAHDDARRAELGGRLEALLEVAREGKEDATVPFRGVARQIVEGWADRVLGEVG